MKASQSGPTFSHLFFADDLILFAEADGVNCVTIRDVLDTFCSISGQTMSEAKLRVHFSPNVDRDTRESLKQPGSSSHDYNFILDKVKQKLSRWKAILLSSVGHRVLIQSSLAAIFSYIM